MGGGGAPHRRLDAIRERYPLSPHGVGLSIGSPDHLTAPIFNVATVAKRFEPTWFPSTRVVDPRGRIPQ